METANCYHILGALYLNRANEELQSNFGEAETHFLTALDYYTAAYMRGQAADTRFMLARLYTNSSLCVGGALHEHCSRLPSPVLLMLRLIMMPFTGNMLSAPFSPPSVTSVP